MLLRLEAAHSQLTVYRSTASVPGQRMTVSLTEQETNVLPVAGGRAVYICLVEMLWRERGRGSGRETSLRDRDGKRKQCKGT